MAENAVCMPVKVIFYSYWVNTSTYYKVYSEV